MLHFAERCTLYHGKVTSYTYISVRSIYALQRRVKLRAHSNVTHVHMVLVYICICTAYILLSKIQCVKYKNMYR